MRTYLMKVLLEFNSKCDSIFQVETLEKRPASIGFTQSGDKIVPNLWGSMLGKGKANAGYVGFVKLLQKFVSYLQIEDNFHFLS